MELTIEGPGVLLGYGTGEAGSTENFYDTVRTTCDGRALAVIRPIDKGTITVVAKAVSLKDELSNHKEAALTGSCKINMKAAVESLLVE